MPCHPARELSSRCESRTFLVPRTQVFWAACPALEGLPGTGTECRGDTHGGIKARKRGWTVCWEERWGIRNASPGGGPCHHRKTRSLDLILHVAHP